jgi:RNA 2',3'-cyclic 3'-phosphodiesterase
MRLFLALDIQPDARNRITVFRDRMRQLAPDVHWVDPETFHVTLQFLGETKKLDEIKLALRPVTCPPAQIAFRGAGFFPTPKAPRVFWIGIEGDQHLQQLVTAIGHFLKSLGFERDDGPYTPHLTLARAGSRRSRLVGERPTSGLQSVRDQLATMLQPDFGTMTAHEFYLYESHLSSAGPRYEKRSAFPLR